MNRKIKYSSWIVPLTLVMVLLVGLFSPIGNAMQQKKKTRKQLPIAQQLDLLSTKSGENAILPVLLYGIERYLQGTPAETDVDRAVHSAFARHPKLNRQLLLKVVNNWKA